jgi:hypothetical protein
MKTTFAISLFVLLAGCAPTNLFAERTWKEWQIDKAMLPAGFAFPVKHEIQSVGAQQFWVYLFDLTSALDGVTTGRFCSLEPRPPHTRTRSCGAFTSAVANGSSPMLNRDCEISLNPAALLLPKSKRPAKSLTLTPSPSASPGGLRRISVQLFLRDPARLTRIVGDKERPVQILFASKAHPHDTPGKELIRKIIHFERQGGVRPGWYSWKTTI